MTANMYMMRSYKYISSQLHLRIQSSDAWLNLFIPSRLELRNADEIHMPTLYSFVGLKGNHQEG